MTRAIWLHGLLLCGLTAIAPAQEPPAASALETGKSQLAEGDRLADEGKPNEAQLAYKKAMETLLPGMRGIPFHHPVKNDVTKREDLKQVLLRELDEDKSPQEMRGEALAYRAFGLWPDDLDYKDTIVRVYTEEIAAFYDPTTKTMHLIEEGVEPKSPRARGLLELLLPKPDGFDKEENKTVIAHELTHALADQHFDIQSMHDQAKGDDDRILALSALIEGEAMLTMMAAMAEDWGGKTTTRLPARDLDRTFGIITPFLSILGGPELRKAPPILSQTMTFPYLKGIVFCASLTNRGRWTAIDKAYRNPPLSTEQILHPEKYGETPDLPRKIDFTGLDLPEGWKLAHTNVLGEFQIQLLLTRHAGKQAAAGWDGDSYSILESPSGSLGLVWRSVWDDESEAIEFATAYSNCQTRRFQLDEPDGPTMPSEIRRSSKDLAYWIVRRGPEVVVLEGFSEPDSARLVESAFRLPSQEKTHSDSSKP